MMDELRVAATVVASIALCVFIVRDSRRYNRPTLEQQEDTQFEQDAFSPQHSPRP